MKEFRFGDVVCCTHFVGNKIYYTRMDEMVTTNGIVIAVDRTDDRILIAIPNVGYANITKWWPMKFATVIKKSQFSL